MGGFVHLPWYATGFRSDELAEELDRISKISLRYGASRHIVYRSRDDRYKFLQVIEFDDKLDWERYWLGPEMIDFRTNCQSWYQVPIVYVWHDVVVEGSGPPTARGGEAKPPVAAKSSA
jgi:hypothetical protein